MATVKRADLEALDYGSPEFVASTIMPRIAREVDSGTVYYQDYTADGSATSGRTLGEAPTATLITKSSTTFSMVEKISRKKIDSRDINMLGGLDRAQQKAARLGKREVASAIEALVIAATFGNSGIAKYNILASLLSAVDDAVAQVSDKADGKIVLFGAKSMIQRAKRLAEVKARMIHTGVPVGSERDVRSISDNILAGVLGVDAVIAGRSSWLGSGNAYDGYLGVMVIPDATFDPDETIQFGRTFVKNAGSDIFVVESFYSDDLKAEIVDTKAELNVVCFNPEVCVVLTGLDEGNAVTTTV
ncbi:MAG TPA: hypothetical protein DET40_21730 [Lentisphaeria bacterium]|nr:hypothetical protein [Lentisphaeria bacterium]